MNYDRVDFKLIRDLPNGFNQWYANHAAALDAEVIAGNGTLPAGHLFVFEGRDGQLNYIKDMLMISVGDISFAEARKLATKFSIHRYRVALCWGWVGVRCETEMGILRAVHPNHVPHINKRPEF